jgi:hypothetical protein
MSASPPVRPEPAREASVRPEPVEGPSQPSWPFQYPALQAQRLLALVLLASALLLLPPLMPWLQGAPLWGWPRWAWALFGLWALLIAVLAWLVERAPDHTEPP